MAFVPNIHICVIAKELKLQADGLQGFTHEVLMSFVLVQMSML